jgi:hypothetical protein
MKLELENRKFFWKSNTKEYLNDALCIVNDRHRVNIICIPKCASESIRETIDFKEKLYSSLTCDEKGYVTICFVRDVYDRFLSGINTTLYNRKTYRTNLLRTLLLNNDKNGVIEYILNSEDPHITSVKLLTRNIKIDYFYDISILTNNIRHSNSSLIPYDDCMSNIKNMGIFEESRVKMYYKEDFEICDQSSKYVIPRINRLLSSNIKVQKYLFILSPANGGSSMIASLINSSNSTTFSLNKKYEGLLELNPKPPLTYPMNWYNENYQPDLSVIHSINWEDKLIKCDKYPPYMIHASNIEKYFEQFGDVYFICSTRHPYSSKHQIDWNKQIKCLIKNLNTLKNVHFLRYEDLIYNTIYEVDRLIRFIPELKDMDVDKVKTFHSSRGNINGIQDCQDYSKSYFNFNETYMKALGYNKSAPFVKIIKR